MNVDSKRVREAALHGRVRRSAFSRIVGFAIFAAFAAGAIALIATFFNEGKEAIENIATAGQDAFLKQSNAAHNTMKRFEEATSENVEVILKKVGAEKK